MGEAKVRITAEDNASKIIDQVSKKMGVFNKEGIGMGIAFAAVNIAVNTAMNAVQSLGGYIMDSISKYRAWETQMVQINNLLSEQEKDLFPRIKANLEGLSLVYGQSAETLANGFIVLKKEGYGASESIKLLTASTRLAIATHSDLESTVKAVSDVMDTYGLSVSETNYITGLMYEVNRRTSLSLEEFGNIVERIAPLTEQYGVSIEELSGMLVVLSEKGQPARTMLSGLQGIIENITKPTDEQKKMMYGLGVAYDDLVVQAIGVHGILEKIKSAAGEDTDAFKTLMGGAQGLNLALALTGGEDFENTVDSFKSGFSELNKSYNAYTRTQEFEANKQKQINESAARAQGDFWGDLWNTVTSGAQTFGNALEAGLEDTIDYWSKGHVAWETTNERIERVTDSLDEQSYAARADYEAVNAYADAFASISEKTMDQINLLDQMQSRQKMYNAELVQLIKQRDAFVATSAYSEALRYIPLALEDATYSSKIFDSATASLVDSIRIQRDEIERLNDENEQYSLLTQKNSLEALKIQRIALDQRHGLNRSQKADLKEIEKAEMDLRIQTQENQIQIDTIKTDGLTAEERRLEEIKIFYNEQIYILKDSYQTDLEAMNLNIEGKKLLLSEYEEAMVTVNNNINELQKEFWKEYTKISTAGIINDITRDAVFNDERVKNAMEAQKQILLIREAETSERVIKYYKQYQIRTQQGRNMQSLFERMFGENWGEMYGQFFPSRQMGGYIPSTGPYLLHKGETVLPANHNTSTVVNVGGITIHSSGNEEYDADKLAHALTRAFNQKKLTTNVSNYRRR